MAYVKPIDQKNMDPRTLNMIKDLTRKAAYPNYRGRKWTLRFTTAYTLENYWDGGSKTYAMAINLTTGEVSKPNANTTDPYNKIAHTAFSIPHGFGIIEHCIFQGKDVGISLVINPDETKVLGYVPALPKVDEPSGDLFLGK